MQIGSTSIEFLGLGTNATGQPFQGLTLTSATFTETICDIPTGTIQFSLASTRAANNPFDFDTKLKTLARQRINVKLYRANGTQLKMIYGIITKISSSRGIDGKITDFTIEIISWLKGKAGGRIYTKAYRFFEDKTSVEIAKEILTNANIFYTLQIPNSISRVKKRKYEVQYGESDINFIKRILTEDGLLFCMINENYEYQWFFIYDSLSSFRLDGQVIATGSTVGQPIGQRTALYNATQSIEPAIDAVALTASYNSAGHVDDRGSYTNTATQSRALWVEVEVNATYETTDVDPSYSDQLRAQSTTTQHSNQAFTHTFDYDAGILALGRRYNLSRDPLSNINYDDFLSTAAIIQITFSVFPSPQSANVMYCKSTVQCKPANSVHRVKPLPRPSLPGLLRGIVLSATKTPAYAAAGTDKTVNTDAVGRVQVRILWHAEADRNATAPTSQPWLRVMTPFAGQGAGFFALPRDGQEVIISFVNGDASQPIVMGCVYDETTTGAIKAPWDISNTASPDKQWVGIGTHRPTADDYGQHIRLDGHSSGESRGVEIHSNSDLKQTAKNITIGTSGFTSHITTAADMITKNNKDVGTLSEEFYTAKETHGDVSMDEWALKVNVYGGQTTNVGLANTNCTFSNYNYLLTFNTYGFSNNRFGSSSNVYGVSNNFFGKSTNTYNTGFNNYGLAVNTYGSLRNAIGMNVTTNCRYMQMNGQFMNNSDYSMVFSRHSIDTKGVDLHQNAFEVHRGEISIILRSKVMEQSELEVSQATQRIFG